MNDDVSLNNFMIAEFNALHGRISLLENARGQRVNIYMATLGVIATLAGGRFAASTTGWTSAATTGFAILATIGLLLVRQNVVFAAQILVLYRRAGRIRCWFDDGNDRVRRYLPWAPGDDTPPFRDSATYSTYSARDPLLIFGTILSVGVSAASALRSFGIPFSFSFAFGGGAMVLSYGLIEILIRRWSSSLEAVTQEPYNIHFPYRARIEFPDHRGHR